MFRCLLAATCALVAAVPTAPTAADAERLQSEAEHNMRQADATIEQLQTDMKRMDTFSEEVRRNLDEEAKAKQDLSHALGYFHRQMQLSSDERDVSHGRVSRLESEVSLLQRKVHQLEAHVDTCQKDKVRRHSTTSSTHAPYAPPRHHPAAPESHTVQGVLATNPARLRQPAHRPPWAGHADRGQQACDVHDVGSVCLCASR